MQNEKRQDHANDVRFNKKAIIRLNFSENEVSDAWLAINRVGV